ncbi:ABC transporter permease [Terrabacter koreensis]
MTTDATTTPSRAAAPRRRVLAQAGFELGSLLRNGEQLLVSLVLPSLALVGLSVTASPSLGAGRRVDVATAGVIALCVISAAFTAQAISTGFDRRYAVLRYLGVTPLGRGGLVAGKVLATLAVEVVQLAVIAVLGLVLGWRPAAAGIAYAVLFVVAGTWAFVALALLLAGTLRAEAVLAIANLVWVLLLGVGGVIVPRTELPATLGDVVAFLPSAGLGDGLRSALVDGDLNLLALIVVLGWGVVSTALAARLFRFDD